MDICIRFLQIHIKYSGYCEFVAQYIDFSFKNVYNIYVKIVKGGVIMEKNNIGTFSILDVETAEAADYSSLWDLQNSEKLKTRKYAQNPLSDTYGKIYYWVGENRDRIKGLTLEQQEEIMIAEGIITRDDI